MVFGFGRRGLSDDVQHRVKTITDVEVGFPLRAIAENLQMVGVGVQLLVKIEDMAVRVTFAENRNKPENVAFKVVPLTVSVNESFTGKF